MDEKDYAVAFSAFLPIGPKRFNLLKNFFGSVKKAWKSSVGELLETGLPKELVEEFDQFRQTFDLSSYLLRLNRLGIKTVWIGGKNYPGNLKDIDSAPFLIYILGEILSTDSLSIGVVGTRKITAYGKEVTGSLVTQLAGANLTIISGLAYGVDFTAHSAALDAGGRTIGVWAGGLDTALAGFRKSLVDRVVQSKKGAIVSEFPLGFNPTRTTFPQRNRIISGMSLGVLVTEAAEDSGSLITAHHALRQGRKVFAVPGPITSLLSKGTAQLIKKGAKLVYGVDDVLEDLDIANNAKCLEAKKILPDNEEEKLILELLRNENRHVDEIIRETGLESAKIISLLTLMEMKGKIKNLGGMVYGMKV